MEMAWRWWGLGASSSWHGRARVCCPLGWPYIATCGPPTSSKFCAIKFVGCWVISMLQIPSLSPKEPPKNKPHSIQLQNGPFRAIFVHCIGDTVADITSRNMFCSTAMRKKLPEAITSSYGVWLRSSNSKNDSSRWNLQLSCYGDFHVSLSWTPKVCCNLWTTAAAPVIPMVCSQVVSKVDIWVWGI